MSKVEKRKYKHPWALLMVAPSYVIYFIFLLVPVVLTFYLSFTNYDLYKTKDFIGLHNYARLLHDEEFLIAAKNTLIYSIFTIFPQIAIGLVLAVLVNKKVFGQKLFRVAIYLPDVTSMIAMSMVWLWIYDPTVGLLNHVLKSVGLPQLKWLFDVNLALPSIIMMSLWKLIGFNMIIYLAALQQIPGDLYEAAVVDGASGIRQFFAITIPMLRPTTFFLLVMNTIHSFSVFEQVSVMTQGGPVNATTTIVHQIYQRAFHFFQMGYASALAMVLVAATMLLTVVNFKLSKQNA